MTYAKVVILAHLRNSIVFGPHAAATARAHISDNGRDSRAFVLVHDGLYISIATACPNLVMINYAISTIIYVEREALRPFLLARSSPAKKCNEKKSRGKKNVYLLQKTCVLPQGMQPKIP